MDAASRAGVGFYESSMKLTDPKPKPSFIESYIASIKQNAEGRAEERHKQSEWLENTLVAVFVMGAVLYGLVGVAIGAVVLLFSLLAVVIGAFAVGSVFKGGGSSSE